jgi:VWFA-related protein
VTALVIVALLLQRPTYTSHADLVVLHVSVLDRHAGYVSNLPRDAFSVTEDGRPQQIEFFQHEDTPVTVGLVIDSSGSMRRRRESVIAAGMAFAASSNPADELFTINFNERVWPGLDEGQDFTSDGDTLRHALDRSTARGQTAFFDALSAAMRHLEKGHESRKVLIVVSDGGDNASRTTCDDILDRALRSDIVVYTVGVFDSDDDDKNPKLLKKLSDVTGGEAFFPKTNADVKPVFERIARDIRSSYTLGYVPLDGGAREHRLHVDVRDPERRKLSVRARTAYVGK